MGSREGVRQPMMESVEGNVETMQCTAALPKYQKLDAEDEDILDKIETSRWTAGFMKPPEPLGKLKEVMDTLRMGFGQKVGQLCQKHPNIVLAPFAPDLRATTRTLYGCKNIISAPEAAN